jgi:hypothetical protein
VSESINAMMRQERTIYGLSDVEKARRRYLLFLRQTLRSFAKNNHLSVRATGDKNEYERGALVRFLDEALEDELLEEFGRVPSHRVT